MELRLLEALSNNVPPPEIPQHFEREKLWLFGNVNLLKSSRACVEACFSRKYDCEQSLQRAEIEAEQVVLAGQTLVCGVHNLLHQRVAVVALKWGAPRIVVFSGGFYHHLGSDLKTEPFRLGRLWRYEWDPKTDLAVSRRAPDKLPTFARYNSTVDRLIRRLTMDC